MPVISIKSESQLERTIHKGGIVVLDFWAPWCQPCKRIGTELTSMSRAFGPSVTFAKVNIDEQMDIAETYQVHSLPTLLVIRDGRTVGKVIGANLEKLVKTIERAIRA